MRVLSINFVGKRLLFAATDKHKKVYSLEIGFGAGNFHHLTGLDTTNKSWSHPLLYTEKLVGGAKWAIGSRDVRGKGDYVPDTLLEGDIRQNLRDTYRIIATYIKKAGEANFEEVIYRAKNVEYNKLIYPDDWGERPQAVLSP